MRAKRVLLHLSYYVAYPSLFLVADTPTHDCIAWFKAYGLNEAIIASLSMLAQPVKCTEPRQTTTKQNQPNLRTTWLALLPLPLLLPCYQSVCPFGSLSLSLSVIPFLFSLLPSVGLFIKVRGSMAHAVCVWVCVCVRLHKLCGNAALTISTHPNERIRQLHGSMAT